MNGNPMNRFYEAPLIRCIVFDIEPIMAGSAQADLGESSYNKWTTNDVEW